MSVASRQKVLMDFVSDPRSYAPEREFAEFAAILEPMLRNQCKRSIIIGSGASSEPLPFWRSLILLDHPIECARDEM
jgi:hypothetical protein